MRKTSIKTFELINKAGVRDQHSNRILYALYVMEQNGIKSGNAYDIGAYANLNNVQVDRRLSEMSELIVPAGESKTPTGCPATNYRLSAKGRKQVIKKINKAA